VTDAHVVLGHLAGELSRVPLDRDAAVRAIGTLGLGDDVRAAAEGVLRVADAEMVRALRVMTVERGVDPRGFALLAFGGAGGLHACAIAAELGIRRVLVPRAGGVLSALGLAAADRTAQVQRTVLGRAQDTAGLAASARDRLGAGDDAEVELAYDCRYRGQSHELTVGDPADFPAVHEERYGYRDDDGDVQVVTVRATARVPGPAVTLAAGDELPPGTRVTGPDVLRLPESTVRVPPGWTGTVDATGTLELTWTR
jgi:N-methylhydantoinase A/oxoprolinase/acetone carboxylase beta subunit